MKYFNYFHIPNLETYQKAILDYYYNVHEYDCIFGDRQFDGDCMLILRRKRLENIIPGMLEFFDNENLHLSFLETLEIEWISKDPYEHIHVDYSPVTEDYFHANYSINFSLANSQSSNLVLFDDDQKEIARINYDQTPVIFRSNHYHSVIKSMNNIRLTVALRFDQNDNLERYF